MNVIAIKEIAKRHHLKVSKAKKSELVRSIQLAEGHKQCFDNNVSEMCGQHSCTWREDCK